MRWLFPWSLHTKAKTFMPKWIVLSFALYFDTHMHETYWLLAEINSHSQLPLFFFPNKMAYGNNRYTQVILSFGFMKMHKASWNCWLSLAIFHGINWYKCICDCIKIGWLENWKKKTKKNCLDLLASHMHGSYKFSIVFDSWNFFYMISCLQITLWAW